MMGTNKRYADAIDRRHTEQMREVSERPVPPTAPVRVGGERWLLVRGGQAVATVDIVRGLGYRSETFYVVHLMGGELAGYYPTLALADGSFPDASTRKLSP